MEGHGGEMEGNGTFLRGTSSGCLWNGDILVWNKDISIWNEDTLVWNDDVLVWKDDVLVWKDDTWVWKDDTWVWNYRQECPGRACHNHHQLSVEESSVSTKSSRILRFLSKESFDLHIKLTVVCPTTLSALVPARICHFSKTAWLMASCSI